MSAHLLPITAERLAGLPDGVLMARDCHSPIRWVRLDRAHILATIGHDGARALGVSEDAVLVMSDPPTAAAVAARVVLPWYNGSTDDEIAAALPGVEVPLTVARIALEHARNMHADVPDEYQRALACMARAAMGPRPTS